MFEMKDDYYDVVVETKEGVSWNFPAKVVLSVHDGILFIHAEDGDLLAMFKEWGSLRVEYIDTDHEEAVG